jgi:thioredoxin reductase (NADPH)
MADIIVIGDGPGGLSAALFLAKNGHRVTVYGQDQTPMHHAMLHNYLGLPETTGTAFQRRAREHVSAHGAALVDAEVIAVSAEDGRFTVTAGEEPARGADYLILAGGKASQQLARSLGVPLEGGPVPVDAEYRTPVDRVYAIGRLTRPDRSQAIISAGAGAVAALDILSREAGSDVHDWDTPPAHDHDHPNL